jgi:predicted Ser/Thr protein kinase
MTAAFAIEGFDDLTEIGRGGFSVVYSARQAGFGRRVAIKVLELHGDQARRLQRESSALGRLADIAHVVPAYQVLELPDGRPALVMALMHTSLGALITQQGPLQPAQVMRWLEQLATALDEAHRRGVHHRDIKPDNVLISAGGDAFLADFGIAGLDALESSTTTVFSLSPQHASPERLSGEVDDPVADDIYSLGSTVFTALAGRPPFGTAAEGGVRGLVTRIMHDPVPVIDGLPVDVQSVLSRALAKDPAGRPDSAGALAAQLRAALEQNPWASGPVAPAAPPPIDPGVDDATRRRTPSPTPPAPGGRDSGSAGSVPAARRARVLVLGAVALTAMIGLGVVIAVNTRESEDERTAPWRTAFLDAYVAGRQELPEGLPACVADELPERTSDPAALTEQIERESNAPAAGETTVPPPMDDEWMRRAELINDIETDCARRLLTAGTEVTELGAAVQVAVTRDSACALIDDASSACWGSNWENLTFDDDGFGPEHIEHPVPSDAPEARALVAGDFYSRCVIDLEGELVCRRPAGEDGDMVDPSLFGISGYNTGFLRRGPRTPGWERVGGLGQVTQASLGRMHSCAVHPDATVSCWGDNEFGQLGDGTRTNRSEPQRVPGVDGVVQVAAGEAHTCALRSDGTVTCWGIDGIDFGFTLEPNRIDGLPPLREIAAGANATCGVAVDGSTWCWGYRVDMLGDPALDGRAPPTMIVMTEPMESLDMFAVEACAVSAAGEVWCFGDGRPMPRKVENMIRVEQVSISSGIKCAVDSERTVMCWGATAGPPGSDGLPTSVQAPQYVAGLRRAEG